MKIIGHRGARGLAPENTMASFKKALELRVDQIEFDVRVTKDGIPIIHHDKKLLDQSGNKLKIVQMNYQELKDHKPDLATLKETLKYINGQVLLYIEVKKGEETEPIIFELKHYKFSYELGSKSQKTLVQLHKALPDIPKIVIEPWSGLKARYRAKQVSTKIISMNQLFLWFGFVKAVKRAGYTLYTYPLNNPSKARRWARHGLAGVVTDFPERFIKP